MSGRRSVSLYCGFLALEFCMLVAYRALYSSARSRIARLATFKRQTFKIPIMVLFARWMLEADRTLTR